MTPSTCPWCGRALAPGSPNCRSCGAPADAPIETDAAGWTEVPGAADMAQLQIGKSACQISGNLVPTADFQLAAGDLVYFAHHVLLWRDPSVTVRVRKLEGVWNRLLAGMPLVMTEAVGPGHIAFSRDATGELLAVPLDPGQEVDVREHVFLAATGSVDYEWFQTGVWYQTRRGNETELHYPLGMFMDRFTAYGSPGLLLLHGAGNVFRRTLQAGESILIKPNALLYKDKAVRMELVVDRIVHNLVGGVFGSTERCRYLWVRLSGPGRVAIQSADKHHHESREDILRASGKTRVFASSH